MNMTLKCIVDKRVNPQGLNEGLDEKIILRADGTAVYITQDLGTAIQRSEDFDFICSKCLPRK